MQTSFRLFRLLAFVAVAGVLSGCGGGQKSDPNAIPWESFADTFSDFDRLDDLSTPGSTLYSSVDPTGKNNDYNHPLRRSEDPGWLVLADLKGPGVLTRFWMTGIQDSEHRVRLFFDDEKKARFEGRIGDLCGDREPFIHPLSEYDQYCWKSELPLAYSKRLIVEAREAPDGGSAQGIKMFFQLNASSLPEGSSVQSFSTDLSADVSSTLKKVRERHAVWAGPVDVSQSLSKTASVAVKTGSAADVLALEGAGRITELRVRCEPGNAEATALERRDLLRQVLMRIYWDGSSVPSVDVPVGDFFGSVWSRRRFASAYFGMVDETFFSRFPMPFSSGARVEFVNQSGQDVAIELEASVDQSSTSGERGRFHAAWNATRANGSRKVPHVVASVQGRGKFVGCILSVTGADDSWWILESDEIMRVDQELSPSWLGTGLEDYFSGAWYYQNPFIRASHGLIMKAPFRTVQYRTHHADPVVFNRAFDMWFEMGPDNASRGTMESVAFYYLDKAAAAAGRVGGVADRMIPGDRFREATLMTELVARERFGDFAGAREQMKEFLETYPAYQGRALLELRDIGYVEAIEGKAAALRLYDAYIASQTNAFAKSQAEMIRDFHKTPGRTLVGMYCNARAQLYFDGKPVGAPYTDPSVAHFVVFPVDGLAKGAHTVAIDSEFAQRPGSFVYMSARTHAGVVGSDVGWRYKNQPLGGWLQPGFDDSAWDRVNALVKGPPEPPTIFMSPNGFVGMQAVGGGLRAGDWDRLRGRAGFRGVLTLP